MLTESAKHCAHMHDRFSVEYCHVSHQPKNLHLLGDGDAVINLGRGIEPRQRCAIDRTDSGKVRIANMVLMAKSVRPLMASSPLQQIAA